MKHAAQVLTVLALAHLLAILGVVGWLLASERLDMERLEKIRDILTEPIPLEKVRLEELASREVEEQKKAEDQPISTGVPISAAAALQVHLQEQDLHRERMARLRREVNDLSGLLALMRQQLETERAAFEAERAAFDRTRAQLQQTEGREQFRRALSMLSGLKPAQSKVLLSQLIQDGTFQGDFAGMSGGSEQADAIGLSGIDQAVAYLDAMPSRQSSRILDEFIKDDPALANELLERLRTRGQVALASEG